jgi:hypothetical protein
VEVHLHSFKDFYDVLRNKHMSNNTGMFCDIRKELNIVACREPLLCNDRETGGYTRAVSRQRLGNHVPAKQRNNTRW